MWGSHHSTMPPQCGRSVYFWLSGEQTRHSNLLQSRLQSALLACSSRSTLLSTAVLHPLHSTTHLNRAALVHLNLPYQWLSWLHINPHMHSALYSLDHKNNAFPYCMNISKCLPTEPTNPHQQCKLSTSCCCFRLKICHQLTTTVLRAGSYRKESPKHQSEQWGYAITERKKLTFFSTLNNP